MLDTTYNSATNPRIRQIRVNRMIFSGLIILSAIILLMTYAIFSIFLKNHLHHHLELLILILSISCFIIGGLIFCSDVLIITIDHLHNKITYRPPVLYQIGDAVYYHYNE